MKPKINEKRIIGAWIKAGNNVYGDENCKRIEWLIDNYLRKMVSSKEYGDWEILYQDPQDGRYWEKIYPLGEVHGGGPPSLVNISKEDAKIKYGINEDHGKNMKMSG